MQVIQLQNESVVEIATFLVRRWSEEDKIIVEISDKMETTTRLNEKKVILTPLEKRIGDDFQKYRQFRTSLWYEAMRIKFCKKILSNDHAFGFILNTMETWRIEQLGRKIWKGMDDEIIFNYSYMLVARPQLNTVYGNARIVEAFYQYFMFGAIKGEIQSSHFEKIIPGKGGKSRHSRKMVDNTKSNVTSKKYSKAAKMALGAGLKDSGKNFLAAGILATATAYRISKQKGSSADIQKITNNAINRIIQKQGFDVTPQGRSILKSGISRSVSSRRSR